MSCYIFCLWRPRILTFSFIFLFLQLFFFYFFQISEILQEATYTALATRANTAFDPPNHRVIGGYGIRPSASPPRSPTAGQSAKHNNFRPYSALTTHSAASTGRFASLEDNIEDQTASVLDSYPIESQAQDLNERVAQEFQATREKVEDWIETHVQCNYKVMYAVFCYFLLHSASVIIALFLSHSRRNAL